MAEADEQELEMFMPSSRPTRRNLADIIMEKIAQKANSDPSMADDNESAKEGASLDPKLVAVYTQVLK